MSLSRESAQRRPACGFTARRSTRATATTHKRIPVTSVPRLCVDLTESLLAIELTNVIHEADFRGWFNLRAVEDAMRRANGRHNLNVLKQAIAYHLDGSAGARSRTRCAS